MEHDKHFTTYNHNVNGMSQPMEHGGPDKKARNYKLMADPFLEKALQKVYRFEGIYVSSSGGTKCVDARDPRPKYQKIPSRRLPADIPVPRFKYDQNYVGEVPPKEVTFVNLNDNISREFLENMCSVFGNMEEVKIYYNPKNKKHLGVGKVLYENSKAARTCAEKLNQTTKMGNVMSVFIDPMGKDRANILESIIIDHTRPRAPSPPNKSKKSTNYYSDEVIDVEFDGGNRGQQIVPKSVLLKERRSTENKPLSSDSDSGSAKPRNEPPVPPLIPEKKLPDIPPLLPGLVVERRDEPAGFGDRNSRFNSIEDRPLELRPLIDKRPPFERPPIDARPLFERPPIDGRPPFEQRLSLGDRPLFEDRPPFDDRPAFNDRPLFQDRPPFEERPHPGLNDRPFDDRRFNDRSFGNFHDRPGGFDRPHGLPPDQFNDGSGNFHPAFRGGMNLPNRPEFHDGGLAGPMFRPFAPHHPPRPLMFDHPRPFMHNDSIMRPPLHFQQHPRMFPPDRHVYDKHTPLKTPDFQSPVHEHSQSNQPKMIPMSPVTSNMDMFDTPVIPPSIATPAAIIDEPRNESLESRIQSLLQNVGMSSPPPKVAEKSSKKSDLDDNDVSPISHKTHEKSPTNKSHKSSSRKDKHSSRGKHKSDRYPRDAHIDDDLMSISSHSSLDDKSTPHSEHSIKPQQGNVPLNHSYHPSPSNHSVDSYQSGQSWQPQHNYNNYNTSYSHVNNHTDYSQFTDKTTFSYPQLNPYRDKDSDERTISSVLEKFVNDIRNVIENDICKKMVESSAFKTFESWWFNQEDDLNAETLLIEPTTTTSPQKISNLSVTSGIASLFESRHPWTQDGGLANSFGFGGGFLGIRGSLPQMPSFKRKTLPKPERYEGDDKRDMDSESDDSVMSEPEEKPKSHRRSKTRRKPVVSESEESEVSSSEEEEEEDKTKKEAKVSQGEESAESSEEEGEASESEASASSEDEEAVPSPKEAKVKKKDKVKSKEIVESDQSEVDESDEDKHSSGDEDAKVSDDDHPKISGDEAKDESDEEEKDVSSDEGEIKASDEEMEDDMEDVDEKDEEMEEVESEDSSSEEEQMELEGLLKKEFGKDMPAARWTNLSPIFELNEASNDVPEPPKEPEITEQPVEYKKPSPKKEPRKNKKALAKQHIDEAISSAIESARETDGSSTAIPESETDTTTKERSDSDAREWSYIVPAIIEHDYFSLPPSVKVSQEDDSERTDSANETVQEEDNIVFLDHSYCIRSPVVLKQKPSDTEVKVAVVPEPIPALISAVESAVESVLPAEKPGKKKREYKKKPKLADITNKIEEIEQKDDKISDKVSDKVSRELLRLLPTTVEKPPVVKKFNFRGFQDERHIFYDVYGRGVDDEDVRFLKRSYDEFIQSEGEAFGWLNDILWIEHPVTYVPDPVKPKRRRKNDDTTTPHITGCARTEGYYKISHNDKLANVEPSSTGIRVQQTSQSVYAPSDLKKPKTIQSLSSREARSTNRRLQASYADLDTDLLRFNQLKFRKKHLKFAKSSIHDWGLFALEPIASDEMVIEYVGQKCRMSVANEREKAYEATGIGSSYMFRVDSEMIIDATKEGNLARFINHSCNPNCYAKVITIENCKNIVIYSKRDIDVNEEITYDYKFPIEDEKIPCLCGAPGCRGTLN